MGDSRAQNLRRRDTLRSSRPKRGRKTAAPEIPPEFQPGGMFDFDDETDSDGCLFGAKKLPRTESQEQESLPRPDQEAESRRRPDQEEESRPQRRTDLQVSGASFGPRNRPQGYHKGQSSRDVYPTGKVNQISTDSFMDELMRPQPPTEIFESQRRAVTQVEKDAARNAAKEFKSTLDATAIVLVMDNTSVYKIFKLNLLKKGFAQKYMPLGNKPVQLVNHKWKTWICGWNAADTRISGVGWRNFALEHCLEEEDALVLEHLSESVDMVTLKVHIFRVVPIRRGVTGWKSHICPPNYKPVKNNSAPIEPIRSPGPMRPRRAGRQA